MRHSSCWWWTICSNICSVLDETVGPSVSEADVTIVADDVVRTIFQKLYSAAMTDRNESENRYNTITFPADISFPKPTRGGKSPVYSTILDRNPCTLQSTLNIGKRTKINVVEDIIQSVLTNLEAFATSKVKALFVLTSVSQFLWLYLHSRMRLLYNNHGYPPKIHILKTNFLVAQWITVNQERPPQYVNWVPLN